RSFLYSTESPATSRPSLHDALPISRNLCGGPRNVERAVPMRGRSEKRYSRSGGNHELEELDPILVLLGLAVRLRWRGATERRWRSEEHTSELQSRENLVCRLLLEKK